MKINRRDKIIVLSLLTICISLVTWGQISMYWSKTACAKITNIERSKGWKVCFYYERNGKVVEDRADMSYFKYKTLKNLQRKECCEIRYSIFWPYNIEIIDKDLKAE